MGDDDVDEALAAFRAFWEREEAAADAADAAWVVSRRAAAAPGRAPSSRDEKQKQKNAGKTRKNEQPKNNL